MSKILIKDNIFIGSINIYAALVMNPAQLCVIKPGCGPGPGPARLLTNMSFLYGL